MAGTQCPYSWALLVGVSHVKESNTRPPSTATAAAHPVHVAVDLYGRAIGAPDRVVARGTADGECITGGSRVGWCTAGGGYDRVTYLVSNILDYFISQLFACTIWRADWTNGSDRSGTVGEGEGGIIAVSRDFSIADSS